jgi:hypothetical protein
MLQKLKLLHQMYLTNQPLDFHLKIVWSFETLFDEQKESEGARPGESG